jgi:hypothetical protein
MHGKQMVYFPSPFFFLIRSRPLILAGFVNPGYAVPPIADPSLYFIFQNFRLQCQRAQVRQTGRFVGDRVYAECLLHVLEQWRLPRRCISTLCNVFASKEYQERLFHKWNFGFLFEGQGLSSRLCSEAVEVSHILSYLIPSSFSSLFLFYFILFVFLFIFHSLIFVLSFPHQCVVHCLYDLIGLLFFGVEGSTL